jgi:DNA gyrase inhibitor GyrI
MVNPKLESRKAANIVYIEHKGPYGEVPWSEYMERLYGWAKEQKVMPGFFPMSICYSDPSKVAPKNCRSDIAITFKGKAKATGGIKLGKLPTMKVVTLSHKGPGSEFSESYAKIYEWIAEKGYKAVDAPIEIYSKKPEVVKGVTIIYAKIMVPVKKK